MIDAKYPALQPAERLHLELHGYVLLQGVLSAPEVRRLREALYALEAAYRRTGRLPVAGTPSDPNGCTVVASDTEEYFNLENIPHLGQCFLDYVLHPKLRGVMQEMVGSRIRLEQSDAHIRRLGTPPHDGDGGLNPWGFHGGTRAELGRCSSHVSQGLYRFPFCKTLTNLTDLSCSADGGTMVIPGSHKLDPTVDPQAVIDAALADPERLVHQVVAPAGSTLCFHESLLHCSGRITSGRDRVLVISGWSPSHYQAYHRGFEPDAELIAKLGPESAEAELLSGSRRWGVSLPPLQGGSSRTVDYGRANAAGAAALGDLPRTTAAACARM
jgi:hypothetical protein